jgi:hypothetical protein
VTTVERILLIQIHFEELVVFVALKVFVTSLASASVKAVSFDKVE